ncbi:hypothetical protein EON78_00045 [bacterium]|nr:MAG: hypothetical protein EON78_00045 [bacterium]
MEKIDISKEDTQYLKELYSQLNDDDERLKELKELEKIGLDVSLELSGFDIEYNYNLEEVKKELATRRNSN